MSVIYKNRTALLSLIFALVLIGSSQAQTRTVTKPNFGEGELEKISEAMGKLLQLKWNGDNLALKRDWDERLVEQEAGGDADKDDGLKAELAKMIEDAAPAEKLVEKALRRGKRQGLARNGFDKAFFGVTAQNGSRTGGGSGALREPRFSSHTLSGLASIRSDDIKIEFIENEGSERNFKISDDGKGRFKFEFGFEDLFVRLVQARTGKTKLIWIVGDQVDTYEGDTFSNFMKRNAQVTEEMLFPLFDHLGIKKPVNAPAP